MDNRLFEALTKAIDASAHVALAAAFVWGVLSIVLSPCHLASIPLIVGFVSGQRGLTPRKAFYMSSLFALGVLITIGLIGVITAAAGRLMGDVGPYGNYFVAAVLFVVGLHLLGVIPLPFSGADASNVKARGMLAAFLLGLIFGVALGPCTFAYMAPVLAIGFKAAKDNVAYAVLLLLFYGVGHCSVIAAAGTSAETVQAYLNWNEKSRATTVIKGICGALVIIGGVYLIWSTR